MAGRKKNRAAKGARATRKTTKAKAPDVRAVLAAGKAAGFFVPAGALPVFLPKSVAQFLGGLEDALIVRTPGKRGELNTEAVDAFVKALGGNVPPGFRNLVEDAYEDWERCRINPFFVG